MRTYAFGDKWGSLESCGLLQASCKSEARKMVSAYNRQWGCRGDDRLILREDFTDEELVAEWSRRQESGD